MHVTFVFLFMHGTTWHSRHLFSSSKTKLIKTETNVLGKKCARFMVLLEKTRVSQKCVSKTELVQVFVYQRGVQETKYCTESVGIQAIQCWGTVPKPLG
jgi:myo-inositol-1-phosphate synthase